LHTLEWVTRYGSRGTPYRVLESPRQLLIPEAYRECCVYLYPSVEAASSGQHSGGSGFVVAVPVGETLWIQTYAVTAKHVISQMTNPVLRINLVGGGFECISTNRTQWKDSRDFDISAFPVDLLPKQFRYWSVRVEEFVDRNNSQGIGLGDDAFMVGRFISQDGKQGNTPTLRFGNVSMMPDEEEEFLVEHRSLPGYSGSPVFVWINPCLPRLPFAKIEVPKSYSPSKYGPWLLGVDCCHLTNYERVLNSQSEKDFAKPERWVKMNTGMACVAPAWGLADLLNIEEFEMQRKADEEKIVRDGNETGYRSLDFVDEKDSSFTKEDFEEALKKVGRKLES
jgi:hypothetical protein